MKQFTFTFFLCVFFITAQAQRITRDFNLGWSFHLGDLPAAKEAGFDHSTWRTLDLPHDWSIEQAYTPEQTSGSMAFLPTGIGWYRKSFRLPQPTELSRWHIEFDGVYRNAEVWINGHYLGKRPYGYSVFGYELTPYLKLQEENTIAVRVDHANFADARWYTGSGIYRNVRLVGTSDLYIPQFGSWVETPHVSVQEATVSFFTVLKNESGKKQKAELRIRIKNEEGAIVAEQKKTITVRTQDTSQVNVTIQNPELWSIDTPDLYTAEIEVWQAKEQTDKQQLDFGIRSVHFTADKGFFLNDENIKIKGVCLHHDGGATGGVFIRDVWKRRLQTLREIGVNAIRSAHNPADPGLLRLCDEMGFVVINEAFDEWRRNKDKWITSRFAKDMVPEQKTGYGDIFEEWAEQDVKDMVRYSRNHPSVIMWSMGNEIEWTYPYYFKMEKSNQGLGNQVLVEETGDGVDELKETAVQLMQWIREVDTTRLVTTGGVLPKAGNITGYFDVPDVIGYNYRASNYDEDHRNYPDRIMYGSENWGTYQEWKDALDRDFVAGVFLWTGVAYLGESGPFPWKGLEVSLLDFAGFYTPRGQFFRTLWNETPYTYLATKHAKKAQWVFKNGKWVDNRVRFWLDKWLFEDVEETWNYEAGDSVFVEVYSNAPEVELFINNKSYGRKKPADFEDHIVKFLVPYAAGEIRAVGLQSGKEESTFSIHTAKWAQQLLLKADRTKMQANGYDLVHVEAFLQDNKGNIVPDKKRQIQFSIEGEGRNVGVDNGWDRNVQKHRSDYIVTHNGKALLLVQSTREAGTIRIKARSGELQSNEIIIKTE